MVVANTKHRSHGGELSAVLILSVSAAILITISELYPDYLLQGVYPLKEVALYLGSAGMLSFHWHILRAQKNWKPHENSND